MNTHATKFDRLRIATPCPISWDQMKGNDRVRFCDQCRLNVFDISELTQNEAEVLIASTEGRICARLHRRADGTVITKDCPVGLRALRRRMTKRAAAVFAALVSICSAAFSQHPSKRSPKESCTPQTRITRTNTQSSPDAPVLSGTVLDAIGAVIPNAKVLITNIRTNETHTASSNEDGAFRFDSLAEGDFLIKIEAANFKSHIVTNLHVEKNKPTKVDVILEFAGETVTVGILVGEPSLIDNPLGTTIISGDLLRRLPWD